MHHYISLLDSQFVFSEAPRAAVAATQVFTRCYIHTSSYELCYLLLIHTFSSVYFVSVHIST